MCSQIECANESVIYPACTRGIMDAVKILLCAALLIAAVACGCTGTPAAHDPPQYQAGDMVQMYKDPQYGALVTAYTPSGDYYTYKDVVFKRYETQVDTRLQQMDRDLFEFTYPDYH